MSNPVVHLTVGIPASGKSTWARAFCKQSGAVLVCRDDIRAMLGLKHGDNEQKVTEVEYSLIEGLLLNGNDIVVADTNINPKFRGKMIKFLHEHRADVNTIVFDVDLDVAIERDAKREATVGEDVIKRMYKSFREQRLESCFIPVKDYAHANDVSEYAIDEAIVVDIDGTVAHNDGHRGFFDYSKVSGDKPIYGVIKTVEALAKHTGCFVVFMSGRDDSCYQDTHDWIMKHINIPYEQFNLLMRKTGDVRPDWVVKNELYDLFVLPLFRVLIAFDDRDQVVRHVRARGVPVAQVAEGRF